MSQPVLIQDPLSSGEDRIQHPFGDEPLTIGRAAENGICVNDHLVSKHHAQIALVGKVFILTDLRSRNGTRVNGKNVASCALKYGDVIRLGATRFRFAPGKTRPASSTRSAPLTNKATTLTAVPLTTLHALDEVGLSITTSDGEIGVLDAVAEGLLRLTSGQQASIVLVEGEGSRKPLMQFTRTIGNPPPDFESLAGPEGPSLETIEAALAAKEVLVFSASKQASSSDGRGHQLIAPLREFANYYGFVAIERPAESGGFTAVDRCLLSIAAAHITTFLRYAL